MESNGQLEHRLERKFWKQKTDGLTITDVTSLNNEKAYQYEGQCEMTLRTRDYSVYADDTIILPVNRFPSEHEGIFHREFTAVDPREYDPIGSVHHILDLRGLNADAMPYEEELKQFARDVHTNTRGTLDDIVRSISDADAKALRQLEIASNYSDTEIDDELIEKYGHPSDIETADDWDDQAGGLTSPSGSGTATR